MINFLKRTIKLILLGLLIVMFIANIININITLLIGSVIVILVFGIIYYILKKKNLLNDKFIIILSLSLLLLGLVIRGYFFFNLKFNLVSDFELYYNTAIEMYKGIKLTQPFYLSFNGYMIIYTSILSFIFKIFGPSINVVIIFQFICQLLTTYILYKLVSLLKNNYLKYILPSIWFILPTVVEANFLVSTETIFILLFTLTFYYFYKIKNENTFNYKTLLKYVLLGFLISFSNNVRPVMIIFIIALFIDLILNINKKKIGYFLVTLLSFLICNKGFTIYNESVIDTKMRSGALEWSLYYGANYNTGGYWCEEDAIYMGSILPKKDASSILLKETINRYKDMGITKASVLMAKKYYKLWTATNGHYLFLLDVTNSKELVNMEDILELVSYLFTLIVLFIIIYDNIKNFKDNNDSLLFVKIFTIGYILANLLVVVNER